MKPTYGRVSRYGLVAYASSLDQIGPFSKSVRECAQVLETMCGFDHYDSTSADTPVDSFVKALDQPITKFLSGPLGGDQQVGANIAEGKIDVLIFFWDTMEAQPHDPDVKALLRVAVTYNIPIACDRATADFLLTSPLMHEEYEAILPDYSIYIKRKIK
jgi:methylglyoxal synthase